MRDVAWRRFLHAVLAFEPSRYRLMGDTDRSGDLTETCAAFIHRQSGLLVFPPTCAPFGFVDELTEPTDLSLGPSFRCWIPQELRSAGPAVVIRAHMTGMAQGNEVLEGVISGESERVQVMNVKCSTVLFRSLAARATNSIACANLILDQVPSASV
jgi:hypothetical protein